MSWFEWIELFLFITIVLTLISSVIRLLIELLKLIIYKSTCRRINHFFCLNDNKICQDIDRTGFKTIKSFKKQCRNQTIETKLKAVSNFYISILFQLSRQLKENIEYNTITHLLSGTVKLRHLVMVDHPEYVKKRILLELITFLGFKDFLFILSQKKYRQHIYKCFYRLTFRVDQRQKINTQK